MSTTDASDDPAAPLAAYLDALLRRYGHLDDRGRIGTESLTVGDLRRAADAIRGRDETIARLRAAVQAHHDQRGDDRCHLDDDKLYHDVLGVCPDPYVTALPPKADMLASCERYIDRRQHPEAAGSVMLPGCMTIAQLTAEVGRLRADAARLDWLEARYPGIIDLVDDIEDHDTLREAIDHMIGEARS